MDLWRAEMVSSEGDGGVSWGGMMGGFRQWFRVYRWEIMGQWVQS